MAGRPVRRALGVLGQPADAAWQLIRWEPSAALAPYVAWHWAVVWDLADRPPHVQATLPHPSVHLVVEEGVAWLYGPQRGRFERTLVDAGRTVATRFRPGGARPLLDGPVGAIADRRVPAVALRGLDAQALARAVGAEADLDAAVDRLEEALIPLLPPSPAAAIALADRAMAVIEADRSLTRVGELAARVGLSVRSLQRLFADAVGLSPAAVIRRRRLQEAAARADAGDAVDWARLAGELGYYDQAHLVRDFSASIGSPPARYVAATRRAATARPRPAR